MTPWAPRLALEAVLGELDAALSRNPGNIDLLFARASILTELGRNTEAQQGYRAVLALDAHHLAALTKLGILMRACGDWAQARALFQLAVDAHPADANAHVNLANLLAIADPRESRGHYETALALAPNLAEAHQGMSALLSMLGDEESAKRHRDLGFAGRAMQTRRYTGSQAPVPVVLLAATAGGNLDASTMLDESRYLVYVVFADVWDPSVTLPAHRLLVNGIADADRAGAALTAAEALLPKATPVLNRPDAVRATSRAQLSRRFARTEDVVAPKVASLARSLLIDESAANAIRDAGFDYPLLLRTPGHHIGRHFLKVDDPMQLRAAADALPGKSLYAIEYLDTHGADGNFRKYRVMIVNGRLYPAHLAVSKDWKVHYFSSQMADSQPYREEEARFLEDMTGVVGSRGIRALEAIAKTLELDYAGIDFSLTPTGEIVLFEANAAMSVYQPPAGPQWAYRVAPTSRIIDAIRRMVLGYCTPAT